MIFMEHSSDDFQSGLSSSANLTIQQQLGVGQIALKLKECAGHPERSRRVKRLPAPHGSTPLTMTTQVQFVLHPNNSNHRITELKTISLHHNFSKHPLNIQIFPA